VIGPLIGQGEAEVPKYIAFLANGTGEDEAAVQKNSLPFSPINSDF